MKKSAPALSSVLTSGTTSSSDAASLADRRLDKENDCGRVYKGSGTKETFEFCKHTLRNTTRESYATRKVSRLAAALTRVMNAIP